MQDYLGAKIPTISLPKVSPFKLPTLPLSLPASTGRLPNIKLPFHSTATASAGTPPPKDAVAQDVMLGIRWMASRQLFTAALAVAEHQDVGLLDPLRADSQGASASPAPPKQDR